MDTTDPDTLPTSDVPTRDREPKLVFLGRGTCIDRYVIVDRLGHGGMGVVYKAYDPELDRSLALKLLRVGKGTIGHRATARRRLLREAQALAQVSHPNVITVYDVGTHGDDVFIAMELVKGHTLRDWIEQTSPSRAQIVKALVGAGRGLAAAHQVALIHRDFKPANVIVGDDGRVRVLDFGLARSAGPLDSSDDLLAVTDQPIASETSEDKTIELSGTVSPVEEETGPSGGRLLSSPLTAFGILVGTPSYMAPEQLRSHRVNKATDQYSFAVTMYEALYGERPYAGTRHADLVKATSAGTVRAAPDGSHVPHRLRRIALRGLSVDPDERFNSMTELLRELQRDPWMRRKRIAASATIVLALALGAFAVLRSSGDANDRCGAAGATITEVWGPLSKQAVRKQFLRSGRSHAKDTFRRVETLLDDYTYRWRKGRVAACEATHVRHVQSPDLLDRRTACLDRHSAQLAALVKQFGEASPAMVDQATRSVMELPPAAPCADLSALMVAIPPPKTPQTRMAVKHLRSRLYDIQAQRRTGQYQQILGAVKQLAKDADAVDYAAIQTEVLSELARVQHKLGLRKANEETLRRVTKTAAAAQMDTAVAWAWRQLVSNLGLQPRRRKEAFALVPVAEAAHIRAGNALDVLSTLMSRIAILHFLQGNYKIARTRHRAALKLGEETMGLEAFPLMNSVMGLANIAQRVGDHKEAAKQYHRALGIITKTFGPNHPEVAIGLNNLGALLTESDPTQALVYQKRALEIWHHVYGENHSQVATALNNIGITYQHIKKYKQAHAVYQRALKIREKLKQNAKLASILTNIGDMLMDQGKAKEALPYFRRDLELTRKSLGTKHPFFGTSLHNMGNALAANKEFQKAYKFQQDALTIFETRLGKKHSYVAYPLTGMGECLIAMKKLPAAIAVLERAHRVRIAKKTTLAEPEEMAKTQFLLSQALWTVPSKQSRALQLARKALAAYTKTKSRHIAVVAAWLAKRRSSRRVPR